MKNTKRESVKLPSNACDFMVLHINLKFPSLFHLPVSKNSLLYIAIYFHYSVYHRFFLAQYIPNIYATFVITNIFKLVFCFYFFILLMNFRIFRKNLLNHCINTNR